MEQNLNIQEKNMPDEGVKLYEDERFRPENLM